MDFNFSEIEEKWQGHWETNDTYKVEMDENKEKYYVLDMFPYPSGAGLHVGHPLGYIASDIYARYKRLKGFNVLHPMGFDAFGLPAEQYAIETNQHPETTTMQNIEVFKNQLRGLGMSYDWSREVKTCEKDYFKWTQWAFLQLFNSWYDLDAGKAQDLSILEEAFKAKGSAGVNAFNDEHDRFTADEWNAMSEEAQQRVLMCYRIAYLSHSDIWYCEALGTVLANDEVQNGVSERGGHPVEKVRMRQWFLRITAYADRLLKSLDTLDWSNSMKETQRNWIGKSHGASMKFEIDGHKGKTFEIFTTRPDTIFGATFMVLAPEHELVAQITTDEHKKEVEEYLDYVGKRSERDRMAEVETVTGAFTGAHGINPFNGKQIPIWISEYVLAGYGTGAIMAVPSDDDRDNRFAEKFGLEIIPVIDKSKYPDATRDDKLGIMINSEFMNGMEVPDAIKASTDKIVEMGIGEAKVNFKMRDAGFSRQRYWGEPFPIYYKEDSPDAVPYALDESELPVELPKVASYEPGGGGKSPLHAVREWVEMPNGGFRETDTMPGYAGSSWYWLRYMDPQNEDEMISATAEKYWGPVDFYIGGPEHAVGHLLYSRLWHKFFYDKGIVSSDEPFTKLVNQGMIGGRSSLVYRVKGTNKFVSHGLRKEHDTTTLHVSVSMVHNDVLDVDAFRAWREDYADAEFVLEDGKYVCGHAFEKMSKRYFNTVDPLDVINQYGADVFRMFEMFLGPVEQGKPWDIQGITGVAKFIRKFWSLFHKGDGFNVSDDKATDAELKILHTCLKKVNQDMERFSMNTCVSGFMVCANELTSAKCNKREILEPLVTLIAPFAPYIAEELWSSLGHSESVHQGTYPMFDEKFLKEDAIEYPVMINGKMRAKLTIASDATEDAVKELVMADEKVQQWTEGKELKKFIFVKGRIVNLVV